MAELNDVAARLAERLAPNARVGRIASSTLAGRRARVYEIRYERDGRRLLDRVTFLFVRRREYQLTCRIDVEERVRGEEACRELLASFRLR